MGEDIHHPDGVIITVNEIKRKPFKGGLGGRGKQDEIRVNLTLVNSGLMTHRIDPMKDFTLELSRGFLSSKDPAERSTRREFNIFPSTQSRVNLFFKVPAADKAEPVLVFRLETSEVKILCSNELSKLAVAEGQQELSIEEAIKLARFYIDSYRYSEAEKIIDSALQSDPGNNSLWMLLAAVYEGYGNYDYASDCLNRVNAASIDTFAEAQSVANQAFKLGHYSFVIAVLEPWESMNRLKEENRVKLARSYYYEAEYRRAERILTDLEHNGSENALAYFTLGNLKDKINDQAAAIEYWEKAISVNPDYPEAYYNIGVAYYKQNSIEKARDYWRKVLGLNPDSDIMRAAEDALNSTEY
jgi:tetratricopeptide (TPR) repeat protein